MMSSSYISIRALRHEPIVKEKRPDQYRMLPIYTKEHIEKPYLTLNVDKVTKIVSGSSFCKCKR